MPAHKNLTGTDLHEPKGIASASANTVYVADGSGSGTHKKLTSSSIDETSILNINKFKLFVVFDDIASTDTILIPFSSNCTLTAITFILQTAITTADSTIQVVKNSGTTVGSQVIEYSGSGEGTTFSFTPASNNTFTSSDYLKLNNDGAATGPAKCFAILDFLLT